MKVVVVIKLLPDGCRPWGRWAAGASAAGPAAPQGTEVRPHHRSGGGCSQDPAARGTWSTGPLDAALRPVLRVRLLGAGFLGLVQCRASLHVGAQGGPALSTGQRFSETFPQFLLHNVCLYCLPSSSPSPPQNNESRGLWTLGK